MLIIFFKVVHFNIPWIFFTHASMIFYSTPYCTSQCALSTFTHMVYHSISYSNNLSYWCVYHETIPYLTNHFRHIHQHYLLLTVHSLLQSVLRHKSSDSWIPTQQKNEPITNDKFFLSLFFLQVDHYTILLLQIGTFLEIVYFKKPWISFTCIHSFRKMRPYKKPRYLARLEVINRSKMMEQFGQSIHAPE